MTDRSGFGLVELIVALTIVTVGLLGLAGAAAVAQRSFISAASLELGADAAATVLDSLLRVPEPSSGERLVGRTLVHWTVRPDSTAIMINATVESIDGGSGRELTFHATHSVSPR